MGLSMREVAAKAGVSQPFLSDLENGRAMPSIATLYRLADTFDLAPQDLLPSPNNDVVVVRSSSEPTPVDGAPGVAMSLMLPNAPGRLMEVRRYVLEPAPSIGKWFEHDGEDLLLVLGGSLCIEFGTGLQERLVAGASLWHSGLVPHRWRCDSEIGAELLLVIGRVPTSGSDGDHE
jgi:transcriptional regulator with XRE-family HTH domain